MGVYIKGLQMPERCIWCVFFRRNGLRDYCCISSAQPRDGVIPTDCPLISVPDHGDLIDRDALFDANSWDWFNEWGSTVNKQAELVVNAPVIIPADRSE